VQEEKNLHAQKSRQRTRKSLSKASISAVAGHVKDDACTKLPAAESKQTKQKNKKTRNRNLSYSENGWLSHRAKKLREQKLKNILSYPVGQKCRGLSYVWCQ
jgi:hypothetical protein